MTRLTKLTIALATSLLLVLGLSTSAEARSVSYSKSDRRGDMTVERRAYCPGNCPPLSKSKPTLEEKRRADLVKVTITTTAKHTTFTLKFRKLRKHSRLQHLPNVYFSARGTISGGRSMGGSFGFGGPKGPQQASGGITNANADNRVVGGCRASKVWVNWVRSSMSAAFPKRCFFKNAAYRGIEFKTRYTNLRKRFTLKDHLRFTSTVWYPGGRP